MTAFAVTATRPSFQMPIEWEVATALSLARLAADVAPVAAAVEGYSTPSVVDVGGASVRLRLCAGGGAGLAEAAASAGEEAAASAMLGAQGSVALCLRRGEGEPWLPAIAGVPGHHVDRAGGPREGLLEAVVVARPTVRGGVTFLHEEALRAWLPAGRALQLAPLCRLDDFHIDDGSGPWLRDRICTTAWQAERFAAERRGRAAVQGDLDELLSGTGLRRAARTERPPPDEWDLAREGQLHRDCAL